MKLMLSLSVQTLSDIPDETIYEQFLLEKVVREAIEYAGFGDAEIDIQLED